VTALQGGPEEGREAEKKKEERFFGRDYNEDVESGIWSKFQYNQTLT